MLSLYSLGWLVCVSLQFAVCRNKIIHDASPLRKRREEKAFEVGELVNGDEFE